MVIFRIYLCLGRGVLVVLIGIGTWYKKPLPVCLREDFFKRFEGAIHRNLSKEEQEALQDLRGYDDIIIKQADKGSAVVILERDKNVGEAMRKLFDSEVFIPLQDDPTAEIIEKIKTSYFSRRHRTGQL